MQYGLREGTKGYPSKPRAVSCTGRDACMTFTVRLILPKPLVDVRQEYIASKFKQLIRD